MHDSQSQFIELDTYVTDSNFDEAAYLNANPDVADAVRRHVMRSGRAHFDAYGKREQRRQRKTTEALLPLRKQKLQKLRPFLRCDLPMTERDGRVDFLSDELRKNTGIVDTNAVSAHPYSDDVLRLISSYPAGLILDCGAGRRPTYYSNVVNFEIVQYDTTDVVGVGEELPFIDNTFDCVVSVAVLEHVRDPFRCASEIVRVLRPGGELYCAVPLLQPYHGYPHHYYNMTAQGLRNLFGNLTAIEQSVPLYGLPVWSLTWILRSWADGLNGETKRKFLQARVGELIDDPGTYLEAPFVRELPAEKNFELASVTLLRGRKP